MTGRGKGRQATPIQTTNRRQMFCSNFSGIFVSHLSLLEKEVSLVLKWFINISRTCVKDLKLINLSKCWEWTKYLNKCIYLQGYLAKDWFRQWPMCVYKFITINRGIWQRKFTNVSVNCSFANQVNKLLLFSNKFFYF